MYAIKLTPEFFEIAKVLDPSLAEAPAERLVNSHLVIDKENNVVTVVNSERFEEYFEIVAADYAIPVMKVKKIR